MTASDTDRSATKPAITARRVGKEAQPVVVVDGFHPDPDSLRAAASSANFTAAQRHYPGIRAPLPVTYFSAVRATLTLILREAFGATGAIDLIDASFSIVTTPSADLTLSQRLPHVDAVELSRIALVHYLSPDDRAGTAFFRHRGTGFELIDGDRSGRYHQALNRELAQDPEPAGYIGEVDPRFERTACIEARYNRAVIYRSAMLHTGAIPPAASLSADPQTGRLTITAFLLAR